MSATTCICGAVDDPEKGQGHLHGPTKGMDFGRALYWLKLGQKVRRAGWNGKGMFVFLAKNVTFNIEPYWEPAREPVEKIHDCLVLKTVEKGVLVPGWLASQTDMLAEDWELVE